MASEVLGVYWMTGIQTIGIVAIKNDVGEVKFYIAGVKGENLDEDVNYIRDHGAKLFVDGLTEFFAEHEK